MKARWRNLLHGRSRIQLGLISLSLVALVGAIDFWTGYEISFSIFYLIPVAIAAWHGGMRVGLGVCLLAAIVWLVADINAGHEYSRDWIPFWNTAVRLGFFVIVASLLGRLRTVLEATEVLAQTDPMTGLSNAGSVRQQYERAAGLAVRKQQVMSIGFLDLDNFKAVNDSLGHQIGDEVLIAVAARLKERARGSDIVGRIGGDEFIIVLPQTGFEGAQAFFSQLHSSLLQLAESRGWPIGFSIGVAVCTPPPPAAEAAFAIADGLMYEVKNAGKNAICLRLVAAAGARPSSAGDRAARPATATVHNVSNRV